MKKGFKLGMIALSAFGLAMNAKAYTDSDHIKYVDNADLRIEYSYNVETAARMKSKLTGYDPSVDGYKNVSYYVMLSNQGNNPPSLVDDSISGCKGVSQLATDAPADSLAGWSEALYYNNTFTEKKFTERNNFINDAYFGLSNYKYVWIVKTYKLDASNDVATYCEVEESPIELEDLEAPGIYSNYNLFLGSKNGSGFVDVFPKYPYSVSSSFTDRFPSDGKLNVYYGKVTDTDLFNRLLKNTNKNLGDLLTYAKNNKSSANYLSRKLTESETVSFNNLSKIEDGYYYIYVNPVGTGYRTDLDGIAFIKVNGGIGALLDNDYEDVDPSNTPSTTVKPDTTELRKEYACYVCGDDDYQWLEVGKQDTKCELNKKITKESKCVVNPDTGVKEYSLVTLGFVSLLGIGYVVSKKKTLFKN